MNNIDQFEVSMSEYPSVECPLKHTFVPGMYMRTIFMPAGFSCSSKIHRTEHPFFVLKGKISVFTEEEGFVLIEAPYAGITKPGTRRALEVKEDTIWITCHPITDGETLEQIEERIIEKHDNPLLNNFNYANSLQDGR